ncbi:MAG: Chemotaxis protein CheR [Alphaproteobacteria bacterium]|nr:Chemotaxis protein CheR [Alphaproteobacteria bacterium]MDB5721493.1 Chemotaxis protein CheR [Alphaproteobacteria bacterium]
MELSDGAARILSALLESRTGQQLSVSRRWRIETALQSLMRERKLPSLDHLTAYLASGREPGLADAVVEALLNNETFFYRDRPAFELLLGPALSRLREKREGEKLLRIWSAGCSTGQEAYSLAMHFAEQKLRWQGWTIELIGTDVSRSAIEKARTGLYTQFEVQRGLAVMQMIRCFEECPGATWRISPDLQRAVNFQVHSLVEPPPHPGRFDIILCRNVLLYFPADMRRRVFDRLAQASHEDSILMLGAGETVIGQTSHFISDSENRGLYIRAPRPQAMRAAS